MDVTPADSAQLEANLRVAGKAAPRLSKLLKQPDVLVAEHHRRTILGAAHVVADAHHGICIVSHQH